MAHTWQTESGADYDERVQEGGVAYHVRRGTYETKLADAPVMRLPVEALVGGRRHGVSFLIRIDQVGGIPLERPALIEGRYAFSSTLGRLIVSPGFPPEAPQSFETALGNTLSPGFEKKCLLCHGQPDGAATGAHGGVACESCHGPGLTHARATSSGDREASIVNPRKLSVGMALEVCAQCHTGFSYAADPLPDDLLISSQVTALRNSECFIQSGAAIGCTGCHNPHEEESAGQTIAASERACLRCHSRYAACPVNPKSGCVGCHMPTVRKGGFAMVDHWIRVDTAHGGPATKHSNARRPVREFLRIVVTGTPADAEMAHKRLANGEDFFSVAQQISIDPSRESGGYLGSVMLSQLDPKLADAAANLDYGQTSEILEFPNRWMIVQRLPRDFRMDADRLFREAKEMKAKGDVPGALRKDQMALKINPSFLRALLFMGATLGETGQIQRAADVLGVATALYPKDSNAEFDLGIVLGGLGKTDAQIQAFGRAIELDPDNVPVYESLGAALDSAADSAGALRTFRDGLRIDPLSAALNFDLSLELDRQGDKEGARRARELALRINPKAVPASK
jgi:predicted CXXCH cytochrome family protein